MSGYLAALILEARLPLRGSVSATIETELPHQFMDTHSELIEPNEKKNDHNGKHVNANQAVDTSATHRQQSAPHLPRVTHSPVKQFQHAARSEDTPKPVPNLSKKTQNKGRQRSDSSTKAPHVNQTIASKISPTKTSQKSASKPQFSAATIKHSLDAPDRTAKNQKATNSTLVSPRTRQISPQFSNARAQINKARTPAAKKSRARPKLKIGTVNVTVRAAKDNKPAAPNSQRPDNTLAQKTLIQSHLDKPSGSQDLAKLHYLKRY